MKVTGVVKEIVFLGVSHPRPTSPVKDGNLTEPLSILATITILHNFAKICGLWKMREWLQKTALAVHLRN